MRNYHLSIPNWSYVPRASQSSAVSPSAWRLSCHLSIYHHLSIRRFHDRKSIAAIASWEGDRMRSSSIARRSQARSQVSKSFLKGMPFTSKVRNGIDLTNSAVQVARFLPVSIIESIASSIASRILRLAIVCDRGDHAIACDRWRSACDRGDPCDHGNV